MHPSEKLRIDQIAANAAVAFASHAVEQAVGQGPHRHWLCRRPGTGVYSFAVTTWPGWLAVSGDIGFMVWRNAWDMLHWARGGMGDGCIDYCESKVPGDVKSKEWCEDVALDWLAGRIDDARREIGRHVADNDEGGDCMDVNRLAGRIETLEELKGETGLGEAHFNQALFDSGVVRDTDFPRLHTYTPSFLWCREALKWLLARLPVTGEIKP